MLSLAPCRRRSDLDEVLAEDYARPSSERHHTELTKPPRLCLIDETESSIGIRYQSAILRGQVKSSAETLERLHLTQGTYVLDVFRG